MVAHTRQRHYREKERTFCFCLFVSMKKRNKKRCYKIGISKNSKDSIKLEEAGGRGLSVSADKAGRPFFSRTGD